MDSLLHIIELHKGNKSALANRLRELRPGTRISQAHINNWLYRDKKIPSEWIRPLSESVDWTVTPHQLSHDIYPHPDDGLPSHLREVAA